MSKSIWILLIYVLTHSNTPIIVIRAIVVQYTTVGFDDLELTDHYTHMYVILCQEYLNFRYWHQAS